MYQAYYASLYSAGKTDEYCMVTNRKGRITGVQVGGSDAWYMIGHAYFDRSFSEKFTQILEREYDSPVTRAGLWRIWVRPAHPRAGDVHPQISRRHP